MISLFPSKPLAAALAALALVTLASQLPAAVTSSSSRSNSSRSTSSSTTSASRSSNTGGNSTFNSANGVRQYRDNTLMEDALIQVDPESRSVVVVTDEKTHEAIEKVINDLDKPRPQVLIKVVFVEVTLDDELDAGLEGNYTFKGDPASTVGSLFGMSKAVTSGSIGGFGTLSSDNWSATLHALSSCGKAKVLSRPSIMARNNQQAVIVVGQEVPIVTASQVTDTGSTINTIQYQDVGIILSVTPFITSNKTVEMIVAPEISELADQTVTVSSNVNAPVINKRSAETVVVTPTATTIVIGGLMQKKTSSTVQKIPLLGDIPLLGHAFRHTVKSDTKSELLIFLTPYIIDSDKTLNTVTVNEANRSDLAREAISSDEIKNNLDTLRLMPQLDPAPAVIVKGAATPMPTPQAMPAPRSTPKATPTPKPTPKATPKPKPSPTPTPTPVG